MSPPGIVTLTTDFGLRGSYVAEMKGVILGLAPETQLVDVTHMINAQNVREGAFVLAGIVDAFPRGSVHLAVVDPGVGTNRRPIAVAFEGCWFVLPDNGLVSIAARGRAVDGVWELSNPQLRREPVSSTFHGRDIFAPAAAYLVRGGDPSELGARLDRFVELPDLNPGLCNDQLAGEVIFVDSFGNLILNVSADLVAHISPCDWTIEILGQRIDGVSRTYGDHPPDHLICLTGSSGWLEVAVVNGNAARRLSAGPGTKLVLRKGREFSSERNESTISRSSKSVVKNNPN